MTPNESLHALLQAFNDSVKKLVHDAALSDDSVAEVIEAAVKEERDNANKFAAACAKVVDQLEAERERSHEVVRWANELIGKHMRFDDGIVMGSVIKELRKAIDEYESQSK